MKLIRNLFFLFAITIFACASMILSIYNYNPYQSESKMLINFYISLAISLTGIIGLFIHCIKMKLYKIDAGNRSFITSIRQATLIAFALVSLLILQGFRILDWLTGVSILVVVILIELFFQTKKVHTSK